MTFCKYCGTPLQDGELCNCEKAVASRTVVETPLPEQESIQEPVQGAPVGTNIDYNEVVNKGTNIAIGILSQIKAIWKKPADAGVTFVKNGNKVDALIFMAIQAILSGVLILVQMKKIESLIMSAIGGIASMIGGESIGIEFPYSESFFIVVVASAIISAIYVGVLYFVFRILKANEGINEAIRLASLRSVAAIPFTAGAIALSFLNQACGLGINAIALIFSFVFLVTGINGIESVESNKRVHLVSIVNFIAIILIVFVASSVLKDAISDLVTQFSSYMEYLF